MRFSIRSYHPSDLYALYRICLRTADSGNDASQLCNDEELFGHYYAAPYAVLEPDLCFVLLDSGTPCGYILGTRDSQAFQERCEREWFPVLRARYALPLASDMSLDAELIRRIHAGLRSDHNLAAYPAHLHIDMLPVAQGQGWGRRLMQTFLGRLRALQVPAVHLGVGRRNTRAIAFYEHVGFHVIKSSEGGIQYGMHLDRGSDPG
jgi:ribosomal protein S18 acetylase RimI-like enzyme